jgi:sulfur carrier protein
MSGRSGAGVETIRLTVNGETVEARTSSLAALMVELGYAGRKVATAVNGEFVAERARAATTLGAGDQIEIVAPRHGG